MFRLPIRSITALTGFAAALAMATGCGTTTVANTDDAALGTDDASADATGDTSGSDVAANTDAGPNTLIENGEYYLSVNVVPFGGVLLPFKAVIVAAGSLADGGKLVSLELRAVDEKATPPAVSDPIGTVKDVTVAKGGAFTAEFPSSIVIPSAFSMTGSPLTVSKFKLIGTISASNTICGDMSGTVVEFSKDVATSTFKAVKWGTQSTPPESSCTAVTVKHYAGITTCPALKAGVNTFTSAERTRRFTVVLPEPSTATGMPTEITQENLPVVLLYHGVDGEMAGILGDTGFDKLVGPERLILVVPESERGSDGKPISQTEWAYSVEAATGDDNADLVFFDDMVKCVSEQYKTNAKRVYVTGMSGGGMMTVFTAFAREKVIAAAAPFSGGYLFKFPSTKNKFAEMVVWGGEADTAFAQNFNTFALALIPALKSDGHFVVQCNHGTGHKWPAAMTAADWTFLSHFTLGETPAPFTEPLPSVFPSYCSIAK
jgi:predicted esterase